MSYQMYTPEGNRAVAEMMKQLKADLEDLSLLKVRKKMAKLTYEISQIYGEVYDSEVRDTIQDELTEAAKQLYGLSFGLHRFFWDI